MTLLRLGMDQEFFWRNGSEQAYRFFQNKSLSMAREWFETGANTRTIKIPENSLEEHFEADWDKYAMNYRKEVTKWWQNFTKDLLTVIETPDGNKTYILDEGNLVMGRPEDTFYFYQTKVCWAVMVDFETPSGEDLRVGYHLPGVEDNRPVDITCLKDEVQKAGKIKAITILYNSSNRDDADIENTKKIISEDIKLKCINMKEVGNWGSNDVFVTDKTAKIYHNEGSKRVFGGEVGVFEAQV